ncbi:MAG: hypothetical protein WCD49_11510 [Candidatus Acidiferrales bacterium]
MCGDFVGDHTLANIVCVCASPLASARQPGCSPSPSGDADTEGLEIAVMNVGRDNGAAARDFAADQLRSKLLTLSDVVHLSGNALAREVHLREIPSATIHRCCSLSIQASRRRPNNTTQKRDLNLIKAAPHAARADNYRARQS